MESNERVRVIMPEEFPQVYETFLNSLKDQKIISDFRVNKKERRIIINFEDEYTDERLSEKVHESVTKEDFIANAFFNNFKNVVKDTFPDEDLETKVVSLPMYSTTYRTDTPTESMNVIVDY